MQELLNEENTHTNLFSEENTRELFIPHYEDWDRLLDVVGEEDAVIHWNAAFFWVDALHITRERLGIPDGFRAIRGYISARYWTYTPSSTVSPTCGFRPALKYLSPDHLVPGQKLQRYALYLDGVEQRAPAGSLNYDGIPEFVPEQRIEFKESTRPETAITWLYNGSCFVADRILLSGISFNELEMQGFLESDT